MLGTGDIAGYNAARAVVCVGMQADAQETPYVPFFDLESFLRTAGYIGVTAIVFAESGVLIGFFFPGDSLLFTAGLLASQGYFNIFLLSVLAAVAAIVGDSVGYAFGRRVGPALFTREESFWFNKRHVERAHAFYEKHGGKAIILARFMPFIRTFAPIVAGIGMMNYTKFLTYNVVGGLLWALGVTWAGYYLGTVVPDIDKYLLPIIAAIVIVSVAPSAFHLWRERAQSAQGGAR